MGDIRALGYLRIDTTDLDRWRTLAHDVLDLGVGAGGNDDTLHLRLDERARRITLRRAEKDNLAAVGWEVRDEIALDRVRATLTEHGIAYRDLTHDETQAIKVDGAITLEDPCGQRLEIFHGAELDHSTVSTKYRTEFVTDELGLGHLVVPTTDYDATIGFYRDVLGFHTRGAFPFPFAPGMPPLRIQFMGVNPRHHSFAVMPAPHMGPGSSTSCSRWPRWTWSPRPWSAPPSTGSASPPPSAATPTTRWCPTTCARPAAGTSSSATTA